MKVHEMRNSSCKQFPISRKQKRSNCENVGLVVIIHIYIYIYRERERERDRVFGR